MLYLIKTDDPNIDDGIVSATKLKEILTTYHQITDLEKHSLEEVISSLRHMEIVGIVGSGMHFYTDEHYLGEFGRIDKEFTLIHNPNCCRKRIKTINKLIGRKVARQSGPSFVQVEKLLEEEKNLKTIYSPRIGNITNFLRELFDIDLEYPTMYNEQDFLEVHYLPNFITAKDGKWKLKIGTLNGMPTIYDWRLNLEKENEMRELAHRYFIGINDDIFTKEKILSLVR